MNDLTQAAVVSGSIFTVVMASQYGRRGYQTKDLLRPLGMVAGVGWFYLHGMPMGAQVLPAYAIAVVLGLVFGAAATVTTGVERDAAGRVLTRCGPAFAAVWLLAVALRLGFIWAVENVGVAREHFGELMMSHQIPLTAIAPFFVIWALTMVLSRLAVVAGRVARIQTVTDRGPVLEPALV